MGKSAYMSIYTLSSNICLLKKIDPKFLKIIQETNFDMGFQKPIQKKSCFFLGVTLILSHLNEPKQNFNKLSSWDIIFLKTLAINLYENTKN
jgi:hypothetical protein